IVGERLATQVGGRCCNGGVMDCQVDYLQLCHRRELLSLWPHDEYWPESKETETHADGLFMERIGEHVPIYPIDVKVSQNRRTPQSKYVPVPAFAGTGLELWAAMAGLQRQLEQLTGHNRLLEARLGALRYRIADCLH